MSFKLEAQGKDYTWNPQTSALRFATEEEAKAYGKQLMTQFNLASPLRVQPSTDPANLRVAWDRSIWSGCSIRTI
jgi:hypothetical protein